MTIIAIIILFFWLSFIQIKLDKISNKLDDYNKENKKTFIEKSNSVNLEQKITKFEDNIEDITLKKDMEDFETDKKSFDFETAFLGNIFNKVGAIAIITGVIIFIKLISPYVVFTPIMKISSGYILSIISLYLGLKMNEEKMKNYKETLLGLGVSISFVTTYLASALFHVYTPVMTMITATLILIGVYIIADKQKTISMIAIALTAGYLNPFISNVNASIEFLFGYYIFVNLLSLVYTFKNSKKDIINVVNLLITFIIVSGIWTFRGMHLSVVYPIILWLIYLIYDILRKEKSNFEYDKSNILNWINLGILTLFTLLVFRENRTNIGCLLLFITILYSGIVFKFIQKKSEKYKPYLYSAIITIFLSTFFLTDNTLRIALWSFESLILLIAAYKYELIYLSNWALGFILASITSLLTTENVIYYHNIQEYQPIFNARSLDFLFPVTVSGISCFILSKDNKNLYKTQTDLFKFFFISLIFLYVIFELNSFIYKVNIQVLNKEFVSEMLFSIVGFKYALQTKKMYNASKFQLFNISSYLISAISLVIILFMGFQYKPLEYYYPVLNFRFLAYLIAIITTVFYAKWTNSELFKYLGTILGFILIHIETNDLIQAYFNDNINWILTLMWIIYAGSIITTGIFKNARFLKYTGIWISICTILRIFIFDLKETDMLYKFIAFISLGVILMIVSYFYNKFNKINHLK